MKRAGGVFAFDEWGSDSPLVEKVWVATGAPDPAFISVAESHWQLVVTSSAGRRHLTLQGPSTRAVVTPIPRDAEFFGIVLSLGTFSPRWPLRGLVDRGLDLPPASAETAWLDDTRWELPTPGNADLFVERLVRDGLLVRDRAVTDALHEDAGELGTRTLQRRIVRATGLTRSTIRQISRAETAVRALGRGLPASLVAAQVGFADQAHLNRSLKRFIGQTPGQVAAADGHWSASSPLESALTTP